MEKKKKKRRPLETLILIIAMAVFCFSAFQLYQIIAEYKAGEAEYEGIQELVVKEKKIPLDEILGEVSQSVEENNEEQVEEKAEEITVFEIDFDKLYAINKDVVAWIRFDNPSIISYPVVLSADNDDYLYKTFEGYHNAAGSLFVDCRNTGDFDEENTIIYGHNMKNDSMFGALSEYRSSSFCKENPYFYIYLPDGRMTVYQVFAACVVDCYSETYDNSYNNKEEFEEYLKYVKGCALYDLNVEVSMEETIVTLSTCTSVREDERFVLHGVKIGETLVGD